MTGKRIEGEEFRRVTRLNFGWYLTKVTNVGKRSFCEIFGYSDML